MSARGKTFHQALKSVQRNRDPGPPKVIEDPAKTRHSGLPRVGWMFTFGVAAYNLVRMKNLVGANRLVIVDTAARPFRWAKTGEGPSWSKLEIHI